MQAVILLNDPAAALLPITSPSPIEFTLRWLERNGFGEVFLATHSHVGKLQAHLKAMGWEDAPRTGSTVQLVSAPGCLTEGDLLRHLDQKDVIKGDFLLVSGAILSNVDLKPVVQAHLSRRSADRQALITLVVQPSSEAVGATANSSTLLTLVDCNTQQLLKLEQHQHGRVPSMALNTHLFGERNNIKVEAKLRPAHLFVSAPEALALLSDNFDYQSILGDLIPGVLSEQELGSTVFIHRLVKGYVEEFAAPPHHASILEAYINRWAYPWLPDNSFNQKEACRFNRGRYVDASVSVPSSAWISTGSVVGAGSTIGATARIVHSVLGRSCHIRRGATVDSSCLGPFVHVEDESRVCGAMLEESVRVRSHATIEAEAVLAWMTMVDSLHTVPAKSLISLVCPAEEGAPTSWDMLRQQGTEPSLEHQAAARALAVGGIPEAPATFDIAAVGPFGAGFAWLLPASASKGQDADCTEVLSEAGDFAKDASADEPMPGEGALMEDSFKHEVAETFLRCIKENINQENAVIELNGLKIAEDRTFADCARYMFVTLLSMCLPPGPSVKAEFKSLFNQAAVDHTSKAGRMELLRRFNLQLKAWKGLLHRFLRSADDQVELLLTLEEYCSEETEFVADPGKHFAESFAQVVKLCYDHDLLTEEAILDWADEKESATHEERRFVDMCSDLLSWLKDAEEESEEEGGESEEEDN